MPQYRGAAEKPYAAIWRGRITPLIGQRGVLSVHARPDLAAKSARRQRDALQNLWGAQQPMFLYQIVDRRSGEVLDVIH